MSDDERQPTRILRGAPHTFGWLRLPDSDSECIEAWEKPNGALYLHPLREGPLVLQRKVYDNG